MEGLQSCLQQQQFQAQQANRFVPQQNNNSNSFQQQRANQFVPQQQQQQQQQSGGGFNNQIAPAQAGFNAPAPMVNNPNWNSKFSCNSVPLNQGQINQNQNGMQQNGVQNNNMNQGGFQQQQTGFQQNGTTQNNSNQGGFQQQNGFQQQQQGGYQHNGFQQQQYQQGSMNQGGLQQQNGFQQQGNNGFQQQPQQQQPHNPLDDEPDEIFPLKKPRAKTKSKSKKRKQDDEGATDLDQFLYKKAKKTMRTGANGNMTTTVSPGDLETAMNQNADLQASVAQSRARGQQQNANEEHPLTDGQQEVLEAVMRGQNVFFTGGAGTGKSHLLKTIIKKLRETKPASTVHVTGTTGIAAVAIGGGTVHKWAGCGMLNRPINSMINQVNKSKETKMRWEQASVLKKHFTNKIW